MIEWADKKYLANLVDLGIISTIYASPEQGINQDEVVFSCYLAHNITAKLYLTPKTLKVCSDDGSFIADYVIKNNFQKWNVKYLKKATIHANLEEIKLVKLVYKEKNDSQMKAIKIAKTGELQTIRYTHFNLADNVKYDFNVVNSKPVDNLNMAFLADVQFMKEFMDAYFNLDVAKPYQSIMQANFTQEFKDIVLRLYPSSKSLQITAPSYQHQTQNGMEYAPCNQMVAINEVEELEKVSNL